jgi:lipopolysaccharide export system protein LptC
MRHSRRVRFLRLAVPIVFVFGFLTLALASWLSPLGILAKLPAVSGTLVVSGSKITMELPRLAGFTHDERAYQLTAKSASQDLTNPNVVELTDIKAKVQMQDKGLVEMSANNGVYDSKAELLTLGHDILLVSSSGYEGRLSQAVVDIRKGHIVSDKPVEVKFLNGFLNANRLEVEGSGDLIRFEGGVAMTLNLNKPEESASTEGKAAQ